MKNEQTPRQKLEVHASAMYEMFTDILEPENPIAEFSSLPLDLQEKWIVLWREMVKYFLEDIKTTYSIYRY